MRIPTTPGRAAVLAALAGVLVLTGCGRTVDDPLEDQTYVVRGIARYADPLPLSLNARLVGRLHDASSPNAGLLAEHELAPPGQIPIPFQLRYRAADVPRDATLTVSVEIHDDGELLFVTDAPIPVNRGAAADVLEITMVPTPAGRARIDERAAQEEVEDEAPDFDPPDYDPDLMMPDPAEEGGEAVPGQD